MTPEELAVWTKEETKRRLEFERYLSEQFRYVTVAVDLMLKAMELEEKHHDALELLHAGLPHV